MLLIIVLGVAGNTITMVVLFQKEHRRRAITPLMKNLYFFKCCSKHFDLSPRLSTKLFLEYRGAGDKPVQETVKSTSMRVDCIYKCNLWLRGNHLAELHECDDLQKGHPAEVKEEEGKILGYLYCFSLVSINLTCCSPVLRLEQIYSNGIRCQLSSGLDISSCRRCLLHRFPGGVWFRCSSLHHLLFLPNGLEVRMKKSSKSWVT